MDSGVPAEPSSPADDDVKWTVPPLAYFFFSLFGRSSPSCDCPGNLPWPSSFVFRMGNQGLSLLALTLSSLLLVFRTVFSRCGVEERVRDSTRLIDFFL